MFASLGQLCDVRGGAAQLARGKCTRILATRCEPAVALLPSLRAMALRDARPPPSKAASGRSLCQPRPAPARAGWAWRFGRPPHASKPPLTTAVVCDASP
eukprot:scaffold114427_cov66-Phaeocystis_antarctica.AAC.5